MRLGQECCTLRAEKYANRGTSTSAVLSYEAALRNLAVALHALAAVCPDPSLQMRAVAEQVEAKASRLALQDADLVRRLQAGEELPEEDRLQVSRDLRATSAVATFGREARQESSSSAPPVPCGRCGASPATMCGQACLHSALCARCAPEGAVHECPACRTFTLWRRAV